MGSGGDVGPHLLSTLSLMFSQMSDRLISRFFLNLRSIHHYGQSTKGRQTAVPFRTHPFWRRSRRLTTGFSFAFGDETSIGGDLTTRNERDISQAASADMDIGMMLRTLQEEDKNDVKLDVGVITMDRE